MTPDFQKQGGLLPVVIQDATTQEILMMAYVNEAALELTFQTGKAHYYSRSKQRLWMKGESSGNVQEVQEILIDCDADSLVFRVRQIGGAACHTGHNTCFYRKMDLMENWSNTKSEKVFDPKDVYGGDHA